MSGDFSDTYYSSWSYVVTNWNLYNWTIFSQTETVGVCIFGLLAGLAMRYTHRYKVRCVLRYFSTPTIGLNCLRGNQRIVDLIYSGSSCLPGSSVSSATSSCTTLVGPTQRMSPPPGSLPSLVNILHSHYLLRAIFVREIQRRWPRLDTDPQWCRRWYLPRLRQRHGPGLRPA